jgi:hypothetical protein
MALVRFRGGPPNSDVTPYTARTFISSLIMDDRGGYFKFKLPPAGNRNHLYWRIIDTVLETEKVNGVRVRRVPKWEQKFPDIYNRIRYGSANPSVYNLKMGKGWRGREWLVANVIDRKKMDIHREKKHTMILCKSAHPSRKNPDIVYYDDGVPAYGFVSALSLSLFRPYKNWENYDVGIIRTGQKTMPYRVFNASRYISEVPHVYQNLVQKEGPLTEEELSWALYDLRKMTKVTSYVRFLEKVGWLIQEIDTALGTTFYDELQTLVKEEALNLGDEEKENYSITVEDRKEDIPQPSAPPFDISSRVANVSSKGYKERKSSSNSILEDFKKKLKQEGFTEKELECITGYNPSENVSILEKIQFQVPLDMLVACNHEGCGGPSPEFFHKCPYCLKEFD